MLVGLKKMFFPAEILPLAVTASSGPGIALKTEAMGLAVNAELPLVIVNWQRGGPSTGLPTKTEQSDLLQAVYGRNGECPVAVIAARSPIDCFHTALEAFRIATKYMTPVIVLSAKRSVDDRVKGLQAGGDDYLAKPINPRNLLNTISKFI